MTKSKSFTKNQFSWLKNPIMCAVYHIHTFTNSSNHNLLSYMHINRCLNSLLLKVSVNFSRLWSQTHSASNPFRTLYQTGPGVQPHPFPRHSSGSLGIPKSSTRVQEEPAAQVSFGHKWAIAASGWVHWSAKMPCPLRYSLPRTSGCETIPVTKIGNRWPHLLATIHMLELSSLHTKPRHKSSSQSSPT